MRYRQKLKLPTLGIIVLLACFLPGHTGMAGKGLSGEVQKSGKTAGKSHPGKAPAGSTPFIGGTYEASAVVHIRGTDGVLFVDDGRPTELFWMKVDEQGRQTGSIKAVRMSVGIIDIEGITTDGTHFYVIGSQSRPAGSDQTGLARFKFDPVNERVEGIETISGLKTLLAEQVEELKGMRETSYEKGGLNIEGVAWDPQHSRLMLGLRSPLVAGQALVVPLGQREGTSEFIRANLEVPQAKAIRLNLGGTGLRSIEFDVQAKVFQVISGAAGVHDKADFRMWEWNADLTSPGLRQTRSFGRGLKPEGVTRFSSGNGNFVFVVFDSSGYLAIK